ncbi:E3 ubiquitin-protein ligase parkin-like [Dysidea avara]|uniref:E3 ubiquitin-protein ligase parkin-like n=1 Tax=Dysidea avara TaxID=196820 RepID=UPI00332D67C7
MAGTFPVSVKESGGRNYVIEVRANWNVAQVKDAIVRQSGLQPNQFKLIFAGMALKDNMTLQGIGVQNTSTLHCIRGNYASVNVAVSSKPLADVNLGAAEPERDSRRRTQFYVYCKNPCDAVAPGKLRVRCAKCKDTSFVLSQDPGGWSDVLTPRKLQGNCHASNCDGTTAEFYFKCSNHHTLNEDSSVALHMIRTNNVNVQCIACYEIRDIVVVFDCDVGHSICVGCFVEYAETALNSRGFENHDEYGYTIKCPADCDDSEVKEAHHFHMMGPKNYNRYQRFATEEFLRLSGGIFCPQPKCSNGMIPEPGERRVECNACKHVFCADCKNPYHSGNCSSAPAADQQTNQASGSSRFDSIDGRQARWVDANKQCINNTTKNCPRCKSAIEKNGGCNHVTCLICKFEFCWPCLLEWNRNCQDDHWFED